jgi:hypothetical protein
VGAGVGQGVGRGWGWGNCMSYTRGITTGVCLDTQPPRAVTLSVTLTRSRLKASVHPMAHGYGMRMQGEGGESSIAGSAWVEGGATCNSGEHVGWGGVGRPSMALTTACVTDCICY